MKSFKEYLEQQEEEIKPEDVKVIQDGQLIKSIRKGESLKNYKAKQKKAEAKWLDDNEGVRYVGNKKSGDGTSATSIEKDEAIKFAIKKGKKAVLMVLQ